MSARRQSLPRAGKNIAAPSSVVTAESSRKLAGNLFELEGLGAKDLKGISGLVKAWTARASAQSRFESLRANVLTELVGREEELELLLRRGPRAKMDEGI
jgi:hypothetical protein